MHVSSSSPFRPLRSRTTWLVAIAVTILLLTFLGASWFVLGLAALHGAAVAAMTRRYRQDMTWSHLALVAVQVVMTGVWLGMAVLAFGSGDTSLIGAWRG